MIPIVNTGSTVVTAKGIAGVSFTPTGSGRFWILHPAGQASQLAQQLTAD